MSQDGSYITWEEYTLIEKYVQQQLLINGFKLGDWKINNESLGNSISITRNDAIYKLSIILNTNKCICLGISKNAETLINTIIKVNTDIYKTVKTIVQELP